MSRKLGLFGVVLLVAFCATLFFAQLAFATVTDETGVAGASTAPQTSGGTTVAPEPQAGEKCGAAHDRNGDGIMDTWDRNMDGVADAFDVNFDGTIDRTDPSISCATLTKSSRLPLTGAPALAIAAIAAAMMGTGYALRRSRA